MTNFKEPRLEKGTDAPSRKPTPRSFYSGECLDFAKTPNEVRYKHDTPQDDLIREIKCLYMNGE
jgi:hypothetical protein